MSNVPNKSHKNYQIGVGGYIYFSNIKSRKILTDFTNRGGGSENGREVPLIEHADSATDISNVLKTCIEWYTIVWEATPTGYHAIWYNWIQKEMLISKADA